MKKYLFSLIAFLVALPSLAQLSGNGYYRVKNFKSDRYIMMIDNKSNGGDYTSTSYDIDALITLKPFSRVVSDPGAVVYVENAYSNQYNLKAQGYDVYQVTGRYLTISTGSNSQQTYFASITQSGITVYLYDEQYTGTEGRLYTESSTGGAGDVYRHWRFLPISSTDDNNYFGVEGEVQAEGKYYKSFYASFPFSFASSSMKAHVVTKVDGDLAVWRPVEGVVPGYAPVIIECAGATASDNRLNLEVAGGNAPSDNMLKGVFFNNIDVDFISETSYHFNATKYEPSIMRLLGTTSEGKLGFVKSDVKYIPQNSAYLYVPYGSPDELTLVTQEEYNAIVAADVVTVTARDYTREYGEPNPTFEYDVEGTLKGKPTISCSASVYSPVGTYPIVVSQGSVSNRTFTGVNGTLTITKAPLTVTARNYTIKQNEPLPQFAYDYAGFKLDESEDVLFAKPVLSCDAPADKTPGTYPIVVSGADAQNYDISYTDGTLTILPADPITVTATSQVKEYGDALPTLTWTLEGGTLDGLPDLQCEVTEASVPGTYTIEISKGTLDYPNLVFVPGTFTVTKAPLTISAGTYTMKQTDERPEMKASFEGFKLDETEAVLTQQPTLTTDAPADNTPGEYEVTVSGAEAVCYDITYKPGRLIISEADQIILMALDANMVYGDPVPQLTYVVSGGELEGEPVVSCQATSSSSVGTYPIVIESGTVSYPNLKLLGGTLTITKAPLTASVGDYTREQGQPNPDFEILYDGFRNDDDASVFTVAPVAMTSAAADSEPGIYDIIVSGGEAENYTFTYVGGKLTVIIPDAIATVVFSAPVDIYAVTGRLVRRQATTTAGLPKGVYVAGGKKIMVK